MGVADGNDKVACQRCRSESPTVRERGRISLMALLCDTCWEEHANEIAEYEGATASSRGDPDPDDVAPYEPPWCPSCGALLRPYPTNYDRWVYLAETDVPAKDVPPRHRWRLITVRARNSGVAVELVAVRVRGVDPAPSDLVRPAHPAVCSARMRRASPVLPTGTVLTEGSRCRAQRRRAVPRCMCDSFSGLRTAWSPVIRPSSMRAATTVSIASLNRTMSAG